MGIYSRRLTEDLKGVTQGDYKLNPIVNTPEINTSDPMFGEILNANFGHYMAMEFTSGVTRQQVERAIQKCQTKGLSDAKATLQAALFRAEQRAVVDSLNVEESDRYRSRNNSTFCNIYAYDHVTTMGGYLPRVWWVNPNAALNGESEASEKVKELSANALHDWFQDYSHHYGWEAVSKEGASPQELIDQAQQSANQGRLVVLVAESAAGKSGHISIITSEHEQAKAERDESGMVINPLESQAGWFANYDTGAVKARDANGRSVPWYETNQRYKNAVAYVLKVPHQSKMLTPEEAGLV